ncbi:MAG: hypothetical protein IJ391_06010 [Clostridia bacterium]|nr:hypothetical protein [Clostridia bacterium]
MKDRDDQIENIINSPTTIKSVGDLYYINADGNDGRTPESAWKTVDKL